MRRFNQPLQRTIPYRASGPSQAKRCRPKDSLRALLLTRYKAIKFTAVVAIFVTIGTLWSQSKSPSGVDDRLIFTCPVGPKSIATNDNEATGLIEEWYNETNGERNIKANRTVAELTATLYDGWTYTFDQNKELHREWKAEQFSVLRSGDVIYESACGEAFNLAMTLQIVKEEHGIENVIVYGNDYIEKSVEVAVDVLEKLAPFGTKIGSLCQGDSSNLHFVPSNAVDLAYTGYIDQLNDPVGVFNLTTNPDDDSVREDLCNAKNEGSDAEKAKLVDLDQKAQEDWHAKWVSELIRIVKPGRPVLIENVGLPYCDDFNDWGGVSREWWKLAVSTYKWDVDVNSILLKSVAPGKKRYHVSMKKNA